MWCLFLAYLNGLFFSTYSTCLQCELFQFLKVIKSCLSFLAHFLKKKKSSLDTESLQSSYSFNSMVLFEVAVKFVQRAFVHTCILPLMSSFPHDIGI